MQIKYITLGLLVAIVASQAASVAKVSETDVKAHNTLSDILNNTQLENILNGAKVNVASGKGGLLSRRRAARAYGRFARRTENEADEEDENEVDENEVDENEVDENEVDENEVDENEVDENEVDESGSTELMRRHRR